MLGKKGVGGKERKISNTVAARKQEEGRGTNQQQQGNSSSTRHTSNLNELPENPMGNPEPDRTPADQSMETNNRKFSEFTEDDMLGFINAIPVSVKEKRHSVPVSGAEEGPVITLTQPKVKEPQDKGRFRANSIPDKTEKFRDCLGAADTDGKRTLSFQDYANFVAKLSHAEKIEMNLIDTNDQSHIIESTETAEMSNEITVVEIASVETPVPIMDIDCDDNDDPENSESQDNLAAMIPKSALSRRNTYACFRDSITGDSEHQDNVMSFNDYAMVAGIIKKDNPSPATAPRLSLQVSDNPTGGMMKQDRSQSMPAQPVKSGIFVLSANDNFQPKSLTMPGKNKVEANKLPEKDTGSKLLDKEIIKSGIFIVDAEDNFQPKLPTMPGKLEHLEQDIKKSKDNVLDGTATVTDVELAEIETAVFGAPKKSGPEKKPFGPQKVASTSDEDHVNALYTCEPSTTSTDVNSDKKQNKTKKASDVGPRVSRSDFQMTKSYGDDFELIMSNLKPDQISNKQMTSYLRALFASIGVEVAFHQIRLQKIGKELLGRVQVSSQKDVVKLCCLDGFYDDKLVASGRFLKVCRNGDASAQNIEMSDAQNTVNSIGPSKSISEPDCGHKQQFNLQDDVPGCGKELIWGQKLQNEDRITEYKRGQGLYLKNTLIHHVRKYVSAFINSEGGRLVIGVDDACIVLGIRCSRKQEDAARCQIDAVLRSFQPSIFPGTYTVDFIPVRLHFSGANKAQKPVLKVLEITVNVPQRPARTLYQNDKGDIFIRRDGSVEGPLKAGQIIDWCRDAFTGQPANAGEKDAATNEPNSKDHNANSGGKLKTAKDSAEGKAAERHSHAASAAATDANNGSGTSGSGTSGTSQHNKLICSLEKRFEEKLSDTVAELGRKNEKEAQKLQNQMDKLLEMQKKAQENSSTVCNIL